MIAVTILPTHPYYPNQDRIFWEIFLSTEYSCFVNLLTKIFQTDCWGIPKCVWVNYSLLELLTSEQEKDGECDG